MAKAKVVAFFYLTVGYQIEDLCMDEESELMGPFDTAAERDAALKKDLCSIDLETSSIVNVSLLKVADGQLTLQRTFTADTDDYPYDGGDTDEDEEDDDDDLEDEEEESDED